MTAGRGSLPPPAGLARVAGPDRRERWVWVEAGVWREVPLPPPAGLAEAALWLCLEPAARRASLGRELPGTGLHLCLPGRPGKVLALGRNFAAHARELGNPVPEEPLFFVKLPETLVGPDDAIPIPSWLPGRVDPEAEVAVLLGAPLHGATPAQAAGAVAAWTLAQDVTARGVQQADKAAGRPWLRSKNLPGFGVLGPAWVPAAGLAWRDIRLRGLVNGELRQEAGLDQLLFPPPKALAAISRWLPLRPGDVVLLGTPAGVSPVRPGDRLAVEAAPLGRLENAVAAAQ